MRPPHHQVPGVGKKPRPEPVGSKVRLESAKAAPGDPVRVFLESGKIWEDLGSINCINHPGSSNSLRPRSLCGRTRRDGLKRCWRDQVVTLGRKRDRKNCKKKWLWSPIDSHLYCHISENEHLSHLIFRKWRTRPSE